RWFRSVYEETFEDDCRGRAAGTCSLQGCRYSGSIAELVDFFSYQVAGLRFGKGEMNIGMPAGAFQMRGGYEGIAAVVAFAGEDEAVPGARKKLLHCLCDGRPRLI